MRGMKPVTITLDTSKRTEFIDITGAVSSSVTDSGVKRGIARIFIPHTTAGITINENADPDVISDIIEALEKIAPRSAGYKHSEGNSAAHIKSTLVGTERSVLVEEGSLVLGTWQGIFFCEFDGPRRRNFIIDVSEKKE